jgi:acyl-CoA thioesterase I
LDNAVELYYRLMNKFFRITLLILVTVLTSEAQTKIKVACIGNSITEGAGLGKETYPAQLAELLGDYFEVQNFGVSGRTILKKGDFPIWQEEKYKKALDWKPDVVVIKFGTNDSKPQNWKYEKELEADYFAFIRSFKRANPEIKIFVCLPIPVFKDVSGINAEIVKEEIIPIIRDVASKEKVEVINLYRAMDKQGSKVPDGVHPNAAGAKIIAETVYKSITKKSEVTK